MTLSSTPERPIATAHLFIALVAVSLAVSAQANLVAPRLRDRWAINLTRSSYVLPSRAIDPTPHNGAAQPPVDAQDATTTVGLELLRFDGAQVLSED